MSYIKKWSVDDICRQLRMAASQVTDPRNDGWNARGCKQDLFHVKCFLEDLYSGLPTFMGEEEWEQERTIQILKR